MTKRSTVDFSMDDDLGLGRPPDRRLISSDNLYPGPPGVGPQDSEFSIAGGKTSPSNNWVTVGNSASRDPRLARSAVVPKSPPPEKQKQLFDKLGIPISPERSKKMETRKSEDRRRSPERDRSRERSRSRSPKRSRDRYREERYDREREDRYRRKRRSPSPPPPPQHPPQREQQFQQPQQFAPNPQQYMAQPPPPMYNDANYQTYPPPYGQQVQVQNIPPQQFGGYEGFMQNPPPYVPSYQPAPPTMITQPPVAPPPQPDVAQQQWHPPAQDPAQAAEQIKREAAVASEMRQQKATLRKQRQDYLRKQGVLKRELQVLKDQRSELKGSSRVPPSPDSQRFLKENAKLQLEIGNKLKTINNVIDMLSGIIGEDRGTPETTRRSIELAARSPDSSPERLTRQIMDNLRDAFPGKKSSAEAPESTKESSRHSAKQQYNYIHYDPEMHWCQICDVFPKTAKEYLNHLHSQKHEETVDLKKIQEAPWHLQESSDEELPIYPGASSKRLPIRGLQHFIPAAAWFCKLCNRWMGDLHCASLHLKSKTHAKAYSNFVEQNPHWETDWMADRQKSYERIRNNENVQTPSTTTIKAVPPTPEVTSEKKKKSKKEKKQKKKNKKRKKSSSSETSGSTSETEDSDKLTDKANSIRVAMRNKLKAQAAEILLATENAAGGKWMEVSDKPAKVEEKRPDTDEKLISNWMSNRGVSDSDKKMFESLRNRMKLRQESIDSSKDKSVIKSEEKESYENKREDQSRDRDRERERERDRDKDYHRDKERDYDRGYYRRPYDRRDRYDKNYRSPDRKRYRNSRSPNKPRVEVGVITNPPPAPKPPKFDKKIKSDDQADGSTKSKPKVLVSTTLSSSKKLPFIGRMPVFKLKKNDGSPKESDDSKPSSLDTAKQRRDAINAQIQKAMEDAGLKVPTAPPPPSMDNSMPDPSMAYTMSTPVTMVQEAAVYAMAPPPPPILHYEQPPVPNFIMPPPAPPPPIQDDLPPGLESSDLETVKVPPKSNKKPLPKDFEDALDIIFPDPEKKPEKPPTPVQMMPPEMQQQMMYGMDMSGQYVYHPEMYAAMQQAEFESMGFIPQPEVELMPEVTHEEHLIPEPPPPPEEPEVVEDAKADMDDLAMLGIDESDITAQGF